MFILSPYKLHYFCYSKRDCFYYSVKLAPFAYNLTVTRNASKLDWIDHAVNLRENSYDRLFMFWLPCQYLHRSVSPPQYKAVER